MNVYDLMATLSLDTKDFENKLNESEGMAERSGIGSKLLSIGKTVGKVMATSTAAAASGVAAVTAMAVKGYASYEQLAGGVEKLFGEKAAKTVAENAKKAYMTSGKSMNEYMESVTTFSASLIKSVGGDTEKAAAQADKALTDMADNVNTFGTSAEAVENAYKGFAKANYTMLDNLNLGYAGSKEGMQQLLTDAEKISGVKYDLSSYSDIVDAIHVMQESMNIAGTTAKEAAGTIEGSFNMTKAAVQNLIQGLGNENADIGELVSNVVSSAGNLVDNVVPRIKQVFDGLGTAVDEAAPAIVSAIPKIVGAVLPGLAKATFSLIKSVGTTIINNIPTLFATVKNAVGGNSGTILSVGLDVINFLLNGIVEGVPMLISMGLELITELALSILKNAPALITIAGNLITSFVSGLLDKIPGVLQVGAQMILKLVNGVTNNLPQIIGAAAKVIANFAKAIGSKLPTILSTGITIIGKLAAGLIKAIPTLISKISSIISRVKTAFSNTDWASIGKNILSGIARGIANAGGLIINAAKEAAGKAFKAAKDKLGIHSPSRVFRDGVGKQISAGIAVGIEGNKDPIKAIDKLSDEMSSYEFDSPMYSKKSRSNAGLFGFGKTNNFNINMTVDGAEDPKKWASEFADELERMERMGFA